jgi:hypothetical protein
MHSLMHGLRQCQPAIEFFTSHLLTNTWLSSRSTRSAPNPSLQPTLELSKTDSGTRPVLRRLLGPLDQFQDPGNKIFRLLALSVLCRVDRRITSCSAFVAPSPCDGLLDLEPRSYWRVFLALRWLCARTHQRSCGPPPWRLAIAVVPNQAHTGPASRCANRRSMPRAGGRRPAPSRGLSCPSRTAMSAPASLTQGAKKERNCQSRQLPANQ